MVEDGWDSVAYDVVRMVLSDGQVQDVREAAVIEVLRVEVERDLPLLSHFCEVLKQVALLQL